MKLVLECTTKEEIIVNEWGIQNLKKEYKDKLKYPYKKYPSRYYSETNYNSRLKEIEHIFKIYNISLETLKWTFTMNWLNLSTI